MNSKHSPPPAKRQKTACPINDLADKDLLNIFKHLPPHERLIVSAVCKRWHEISRIPWRDVITLDLSTVRSFHIGTIVKRCPNLQTIIARGYDFQDASVEVFSRVNLSSLRLYNCSAELEETDAATFDPFSAMFSDRLSTATWDELVLHSLKLRVNIDEFESSYGCPIAGTLPASLKRLQLSGDVRLKFDGGRGVWKPSGEGLLDGLVDLQNLTCLIVSSTSDKCLIEPDLMWLFKYLHALTNLTELCVSSEHESAGFYQMPDIEQLAFKLPKLEVLFLNNVVSGSEQSLIPLATKHPTLRILAITGSVDNEETIPARLLYPDGFASDPLPLLHIFLGRQAVEKLRFEESPSDSAKIHEITEPLPAFLEKKEIAPIFDDVWIAGQIKEGAKHGAELWEYSADV